ncbi:MAG: phosphate acetyltransferase [Salaquimonas sp.]
MSALQRLIKAAAAAPSHIVLPEGEDIRIIEGGLASVRGGIAKITLLGNQSAILKKLSGFDGGEAAVKSGDVMILDPVTSDQAEGYAASLLEFRSGKVADKTAALKLVHDPLVYAAMMVREGNADGTLGGAVYTTADTVRTALQIIGKAADAKIVSSFFLMVLPKGRHGNEEVVVFSDCGLVVDPDSAQLAGIAIASAASFKALTNEEPLVGMLSFSTKGSARHANVSKVSEATALAKELAPNLNIDGELQFDAAFVDSVGASKAPGSEVAGKANVLIFPNLDAGNIGYKIAQRIGGAMALGPVLQGLAKPANDLSRGCTADDVLNMIAVTVNQVRLSKG